MRRFILPVMLFSALTFPAAPAGAQDPGDVPEQGVARISLLSGDVSVRRGDSGEVIDAELNAPLVALDHVLTNVNARAEIQLDWANILRLAPDSEVRMAELADRRFRIQLAAGMMTVSVLRDSQGRVEISTPTAVLHPRDRGTYRIVVRPDYSTEVAVRSGNMDVFVDRQFSTVRSGQAMVIDGDPSNPQRVFVSAGPRDDWDRWNESRDRDLERSDSYKYVSRDIYGAEDLHGHGRWVHDPPYGWVWAPHVAVDWAPYRVGRWTWTAFYGWTWVSGDPWGWAPYHYGRWYQAPRHGWVWYPGPVNARYYWRPALVGFFGWGDGPSVRVGFGFGNVGWVPLAPYEVYRPWYGRNNVTIVNVIHHVDNVVAYRNARDVRGRNAFTAIHAEEFGRRRTNVNDFVRVSDRQPGRVLDTRSRGTFDTPRQNPGQDRSPTGRGNVQQNPQNNGQTPRQRPDSGVAANPRNGSGDNIQPRGNRERLQADGAQQPDSLTRPNVQTQPGLARGDTSQREPRRAAAENAGNRGLNRGNDSQRPQEPIAPVAGNEAPRQGQDRAEARAGRGNSPTVGVSPQAREAPRNRSANIGAGVGIDQRPQRAENVARAAGGRPSIDRPAARTGGNAPTVASAAPQAQARGGQMQGQGRAQPQGQAQGQGQGRGNGGGGNRGGRR